MGKLDVVRKVLHEAVATGEPPGAVVAVGRGEELLLLEAAGARRLVPDRQPMLPDTLFDLASLTKPLVTATLAVQLVEEGQWALGEPVAEYLPQFSGDGREKVLLRDLLTHSSGLPGWKNYLELRPSEAEDRASRVAGVVADICATPLQAPAGERFIYSDLNFILLGVLIERLRGQALNAVARGRIFAPAGMDDSGFNPPADEAERCAATEVVDGEVLQGVVHDENARYLGGIAGHAGLFSTAEDVARFCQMLLRGGRGERGEVLSPAAVAAMTSPQSRHRGHARGLGWDVFSDYSPSVRGDLFPAGGFGHRRLVGIN